MDLHSWNVKISGVQDLSSGYSKRFLILHNFSMLFKPFTLQLSTRTVFLPVNSNVQKENYYGCGFINKQSGNPFPIIEPNAHNDWKIMYKITTKNSNIHVNNWVLRS